MLNSISPITEKVVELFFENVKVLQEKESTTYSTFPREILFEYKNFPTAIPYRIVHDEFFFVTPRYGTTGVLGLFLYFFERFEEKDDLLLIVKPKKDIRFFKKYLPSVFKKKTVYKMEPVRVSPYHFSNIGIEKTCQEEIISSLFLKQLFEKVMDVPLQDGTLCFSKMMPAISICLGEFTRNAEKEKSSDLEIPFKYKNEEVVASFTTEHNILRLDKLYDNTSSLRKANYSYYEFERNTLNKLKLLGYHFVSSSPASFYKKILFQAYGDELVRILKIAVDADLQKKITTRPIPSFSSIRKLKPIGGF